MKKPTTPTSIIDKNGRATTVHRADDTLPVNASAFAQRAAQIVAPPVYGTPALARFADGTALVVPDAAYPDDVAAVAGYITVEGEKIPVLEVAGLGGATQYAPVTECCWETKVRSVTIHEEWGDEVEGRCGNCDSVVSGKRDNWYDASRYTLVPVVRDKVGD